VELGIGNLEFAGRPGKQIVRILILVVLLFAAKTIMKFAIKAQLLIPNYQSLFWEFGFAGSRKNKLFGY